ncbi:MAG TPA: tyrosine-type recombinase/integrase [Nodularia sp. (in: cyanobacteria)]|nr:tyrosine-type recombinase/integrase [Nodularia sp. (in: cyanobacteria)]
MDEDKWINVDPQTKKLSLRFRVRGFSRQFYLSTGLKDNKVNRGIVRARKEIIERDIALRRFDSTLESYKFGNYQNAVITVEHKLFLDKLWNDFMKFQSQHLEPSTLAADYKSITTIINNLPTQCLTNAALIRDFLLEKYSYHSAHKALAAFSRCCKWAVDSSLIEANPFEKVQIPRPKKHSNESQIEAYTLEERDLIITAFENHAKFCCYSSLVKFLFWTGCRPGESFALTWGDVSSDCCRISINKAYASRVRLLKGTKNNKRRVFISSVKSKLQSLLLDIRPQSPNPEELVFKTRSGQQMSLKVLDISWRGNRVHEYEYKGVVTELAEKRIVPYLKIYSTRHTFATWAIASGSSPEKVAYWLGDDVRTVLRYYCHPDVTKTECPDF